MGWSSVDQSRRRLLSAGILALGFRGEGQARERASRTSAGLGGRVGLADPGRCPGWRPEELPRRRTRSKHWPDVLPLHPRVKRAKKTPGPPTEPTPGQQDYLGFLFVVPV